MHSTPMTVCTESNSPGRAIRHSGGLLVAGIMGFLMLLVLNRSTVLMIGSLLILACLILMLRWPDAGTLVVLFAIYSNIGVIAMRSPNAVLQSAGSLDQNPRIAIVFVALSLLLCMPLLDQIFIRKQPVIFDRGFLLMLAFLAASLASCVFARDQAIVLSQIADYLLEGVGLYFLLINVIRTLPMLRRAIWTLLVAGVFMGGLTVLQHATGARNHMYGGLAQLESDFKTNPRMPGVASRATANQVGDNGEIAGQLRAAGPIGETNRYGQILLVLLPLAALAAKIEPSRRLRLLAKGAAIMIFGALLLTYSRGNLVALLFAFVLMACLGFWKAKHVIGTVAALCVLIAVVQPGVVMRMLTLERLKPLLLGNQTGAEAPDSSAIRRYVENVAAWRVFLDHPIVGVGPGHFAAYYSNDYGNRVGLVEQTHGYRAHNLYFEVLAETGVIGFICFLAVPIAIGHDLWRERRRLMRVHPSLAYTATALFVALGAYGVSAIFDHLSYQRYFWLLLAVSAAALRTIRSEADRRNSLPAPTEA
jgi:putative inorganic carbon (HCO3(-)) transporter